MKTFLAYFFKSIKVPALCILTFMVAYILSSWSLPMIHVNRSSYPNPGAQNTIYLMINGVHTDLVLPLRSNVIFWDSLVPFGNTTSKDATCQWLAFGWGDKGFYLNTPTWDDLTFETAFKAATGLSSTAIHCTYYKRVKEDVECIKILITDAQLYTLSQYVKNSFELSSSNKFIWIETNAVYGKTDAFYEAIGSYSLFTTCNTWTNNGLKSCGFACLLVDTVG